MHIRDITLTDHLDGMTDLLREHWDEIARNKSLMVLAPDHERYKALEDSGALFTLGVFDAADQLVGYSVNLIDQHLHYSGLRYSANDVLFLQRQHRGGFGRLLIEATEHRARELGSKLHLWHAKGDTALQGLLERGGYPVQDIVFSKEL